MTLTKFLCSAFSFCFLFSGNTALLIPKHETHSAFQLRAATAIPLDKTDESLVLPSENKPNIGVLLLNLGGPETGDDVEEFLFNLFADPDIIRLPKFLSPLQDFIAYIISKRRAPKSRAAYESIGGGSPILKYSNAQKELLCKDLKERFDLDVKSYIGMRYWHPFTEEALDQIRKDNINALVILPLYPQFSISTSGSSLRILQEQFAKNTQHYGPDKMVHTVVPSWYDRPGYVKAMADLIKKELDSFTPAELAEAGDAKCARHVLFSAHGVPASYIEAGDPYQRQIRECVDKISAALPGVSEGVQVHLSYQSRVGPIEWLRPYTDDVLPQLGQQGVKNLVVVPISFVSEHIETLEEIDIEYRELAVESGIENWRRCPALNTDKTFIADMADMVAEALSQPSQTVTEACIANNCGDVEQFDQRLGFTGVQGVGAEADLRVAGRLHDKERINGRVAIFGLLATILIELTTGQSLTDILGISFN
eukprot:CAMPEP_0194202274 /NCGR_PEP_ID=MMETSP0156-20130528/2339_1 /TAXON_ID=33649 /ORGANISM="Thalassionema nitzschioides, Strain L26-B" /LENGTH=480 /DNA_ID=CAMNT_0038927723 /DNA_START=110 /DNA_END=1552 /DNA_ORIENTATION=+